MKHHCLGRGRPLLFVAVSIVLPASLEADCIDYSACLHWEGNVYTSLTVYGMATSGTNAFLASGLGGLYVVDVSDPSIPRVSARIDSLSIYQVAAEGPRLYVREPGGMRILDISNPTAPSTLGTIDQTGVMAPLGDLLLLGADSLRVLDVHDPGHSFVVGTLDLPGTTRSVEITYPYACIASSGGSNDPEGEQGFDDFLDSLLVVDMSEPSAPVWVGTLALPGYITSIVVDGSLLYIALGGPSSRKLIIADITDPTEPNVIGDLPIGGTAWDLSLSGTLVLVGTWGGPLEVVDVSSPNAPQKLATIPLEDPGLVYLGSSGSLQLVSISVEGVCPYCPSYSTLRVLDLGNGYAPPLLGNIPTGGFAWGAVALGERLYVPADAAGLEIYDLTDTLHARLGSLNTPGAALDVAVQGSLAIIADDTDLITADISDPQQPLPLGTLSVPGSARSVVLADTIALAACGGSGLLIVDVADPSDPLILGSLDTPYYATDVALAGNYAYVTDRAYGLFVIDISNPRLPQLVGSLDTPGFAMALALSGTLAYIADDTAVRVINISNPASPVLLGSTGTPGSARGISVIGSHVYVADAYEGLAVLDASIPSLPVIIGGDQGFGACFGVSASDRVYLSDGVAGLHVFPLDCTDVVDIRLSGFTAASQAEGILLTWNAPEGEWAAFQVERSLQPHQGYERITLEALVANRFLDVSIEAGRIYYYRLEAQDRTGSITRFGPVSARFDPPPLRTMLGQNRPNPLATGRTTSILFTLASEERARIRVFDLSGRIVRELIDANLGPGEHKAIWDGRDDRGRVAPDGIYVYRLETGNFTAARKMVKLP